MPSIRTGLRLTNNTPLNMKRIWVTETDNNEWDGVSRPDHNFQNVSLPSRAFREEREDLNSLASSSWYRLHIEFQNGDVISYKNDQYDARHKYTREIPLNGYDAGKYMVTQICGDGWNKITISMRPTTRSWMDKVSGNSKLCELNIPGTHGSCARYGEKRDMCQTMSLREQLDAGIRFIDIGCRHIENVFTIYHEQYYQKLNFGEGVRDVCVNFLKEHPRETIIMSVKHEYDDKDVTRSFEDTFRWYLRGYESMWYLADTIPPLDEVRGKIVLLRRFEAKSDLGIDASSWEDNKTFTIENNPEAVLYIQDEHKVWLNPDPKWLAIKCLFNQAQEGNMNDWYLNFVSGAGDNPPEAIALLMNHHLHPRLYRCLETMVMSRFGTIIMDFPYNSIVEPIIATNEFLV